MEISFLLKFYMHIWNLKTMPVNNESSHLEFESVHEILKYDHSNETTWLLYGQYFPVVLFIMLYNVVLNLTLCMKSLSVTIHNESYCGTLLQWYVAKGLSGTTRVHPWETFVIENCFW